MPTSWTRRHDYRIAGLGGQQGGCSYVHSTQHIYTADRHFISVRACPLPLSTNWHPQNCSLKAQTTGTNSINYSRLGLGGTVCRNSHARPAVNCWVTALPTVSHPVKFFNLSTTDILNDSVILLAVWDLAFTAPEAFTDVQWSRSATIGSHPRENRYCISCGISFGDYWRGSFKHGGTMSFACYGCKRARPVV